VTGPTETPRLSIVIVSWESGPDLVQCVQSLAAAREAGRLQRAIELVVVDNASREFPGPEVTVAWPGATVIRNPSNRGFGPAANQGVAAAHGDIVLLLNPDTRAVDEPLTPLLAAFSEHAGTVAIAPRLLEDRPPGGKDLCVHQLRRLPTLGHVAREMLLVDRAFPRNRWLARDRYLDRDQGQPFEVQQPAGAALAVRREAFVRLGGFDERFVPAWFEDVDLCTRLLPLGKILYWPASQFAHTGGTAARKLGYDEFLPIYHRNALRYWRKHHGRAASTAYRALVAAGMLLRLLVLPFSQAPASKRTAARAYTRVLRGVAGFGWGGAAPMA
jgi:N-acetylglucosaminyl-diphospho-decaprenol L-rhamnosyltransferase